MTIIVKGFEIFLLRVSLSETSRMQKCFRPENKIIKNLQLGIHFTRTTFLGDKPIKN